MRNKFAWMAILIVIVALVFVVSPVITGFYLERKYQQILDVYRDNKQVAIQLSEYKRGWFHSEAVLSIKLLDLSWGNMLDDDIPKEYVIDQYIQHGPFIYYYRAGLPSVFGLGAIHNTLHFTPEIKDFFARYHLNSHLLQVNDDFIAFNGNFYKHMQFSTLQAVYPNSDIQITVNGLESEIWLTASQERFSGTIQLKGITIADDQVSISIPHVELQFDQHQDAHNFWLGKNTLVIPEVTWAEVGKTALGVYGVNFNGYLEEKSGMLNGSRQFDVTKVTIDDSQAGPFHLQLTVNNLNAQAVLDMINAYREISQRGELYQSQLQQRLTMMVPSVINQGSTLKLDSLDITTPEGMLQMRGELAWDLNKESIPDNVSELIQVANAQLDLRISKTLIDKWIDFASNFSYFNQPTPALQQTYKEARQDIYQAMQQNTNMIVELSREQLLTDKDALELLILQKKMISLDEYNKVIRKLLLEKSISLETSHMLSYLYAQVKNPAIMVANLINDNSQKTQDNMHAQITNWLKNGYIKQENNDYVISLSQGAKGVKINEKLISAPLNQ